MLVCGERESREREEVDERRGKVEDALRDTFCLSLSLSLSLSLFLSLFSPCLTFSENQSTKLSHMPERMTS
jgi:hypothetical protein